jgi:hypothetical protein
MRNLESIGMTSKFPILVALAGLLVGAAARAEPPAPPPAHTLAVGGGEVAGAYYPEAGAICRVVNSGRDQHGMHCLVEPSAGSAANLAGLRGGDQQLAIVQSKALAQAIAGSGPFAGQPPFTELRSLMSLHGEALAVLVAANAKIKTPADLKGKRLNLGHPGSYQRAMGEALLEAEGLHPTDLAAALEMEPGKLVKALCNNQIDAAFVTGIHPVNEVQEAMDDCGATLLPLKDAALDAYLKGNPAFSRLTINADDYQGLHDKVPSFGLRAVLVTTDKLSAADGYALVKAVFDNFTPFKQMHPLLGELERKQMARDALVAPLQEGAERYYKENGLP